MQKRERLLAGTLKALGRFGVVHEHAYFLGIRTAGIPPGIFRTIRVPMAVIGERGLEAAIWLNWY